MTFGIRAITPLQRGALFTSGVRGEAEAILIEADIRPPMSGAGGTLAATTTGRGQPGVAKGGNRDLQLLQ